MDSPVLALYDPLGVHVTLNFDIINRSFCEVEMDLPTQSGDGALALDLKM